MVNAIKAQNKHYNIHPKNGRWFVCMMAGAPLDRARELRDKLAKTRGTLVQYHLDYEKQNDFDIKQIPEDVDFVIIIKSQLGHSIEGKIKNATERWKREHNGEEMTVIKTSHKWSNLDQVLRNRMNLSKTESLPLAVISTAYFKEPKEEVVVKEPEPPKTVRNPEDVAREKFMQMDTLVLLRELQIRMQKTGIDTLMVTPKEYTFSIAEPNKEVR